jgi:hypothetical protein
MFCSYYKLFYFSINCLQRSFLHHFRYATPTIPSCPPLITHSTIIFVFSSNNNTILFTIFNITIFLAISNIIAFFSYYDEQILCMFRTFYVYLKYLCILRTSYMVDKILCRFNKFMVPHKK